PPSPQPPFITVCDGLGGPAWRKAGTPPWNVNCYRFPQEPDSASQRPAGSGLTCYVLSHYSREKARWQSPEQPPAAIHPPVIHPRRTRPSVKQPADVRPATT